MSSLLAPMVLAPLSVALITACSSSSPARGAARTSTTATAAGTHGSPATTAMQSVSTSVQPVATTTTLWLPSAPQPSPDAAAAAVINDWSTGNRTAAAAVASPAAVSALFAQPYPSGYMQPRGCTDASSNPGTCTYADRATGSLYEITVARTGAAWFVSSVSVES